MILEAGMFGHSDSNRLRVIHLCQCTFSFSSPPFLNCSNLRFLLLDHCKDKDTADHGGEEKHHSVQSDHDAGACFRKLWVLDISYTDWYFLLSEKMMELMVELRELNVKGVKNWSISHLRRGSGAGSNNNNNLLKLHVTAEPADINQAPLVVAFADLSSWSILKTVILDGCVELEQIGPNVLPPLIESFSFFSNVASKIKSMSFQGCAQFKSLLLRGLLENLEEMDMSGTVVKTLDLSATEAPRLKRLFLLRCDKLCAILWPQKGEKPKLDVLRIDTTQVASAREDNSNKVASNDTSVGSSSAIVPGASRALDDKDSYISLRDARLFWSLHRVELRTYLHMEVSSAGTIGGHKGASQGINSSKQRKPAGNLYMDDIIAMFKDNLQTDGADRDVVDAPATMWMWPCPPIPSQLWWYCNIRVQDKARTKVPQSTTGTKQETGSTTLPDFVPDQAVILHLHDSLSITSITGPAPATIDLRWSELWWCRVERCPNLEGPVFTATPSEDGKNMFWALEIFCASQLLNAGYIWDWSVSSFRPGSRSFEDLKFLYLDNCPRLIHVLPLYSSNDNGCCSLETLEIVCCGDLREVFPRDSDSEQQVPRGFPRLKHIHLHELPKLQRICGHRMFAPNLERLKIRGCWSLRRLPAVHRHSGGMPPPEVDCEKEWWAHLQWDGEEADHHPSLYKPSHSKYYKKTLLRGSVLR
uniref:Disease resistance protein At4g27190-like leucine-rich repeats domain-containing protein n=1 Tax=Arundo donax TaxID=35708 RepID=A0A0A9DQ55_ARUDO